MGRKALDFQKISQLKKRRENGSWHAPGIATETERQEVTASVPAFELLFAVISEAYLCCRSLSALSCCWVFAVHVFVLAAPGAAAACVSAQAAAAAVAVFVEPAAPVDRWLSASPAFVVAGPVYVRLSGARY